MNFKGSSIAILSLALLSACSSQIGTLSGNASLGDANFTVVDVAYGNAQTCKVFGLGGTKRENLVLDAKSDLYRYFPLKKGQALANVSVDYTNKYYVLYSKTNVNVSAEIVDFNPSYDTTAAQFVYKKLASNSYVTRDGFHVNELVYYKDNEAYGYKKIFRLLKNNVEIIVDDAVITVGYESIFKPDITESIKNYQFKINDEITFSRQLESESISGTIVGAGINGKYLVKSANGTFNTFSTDDFYIKTKK